MCATSFFIGVLIVFVLVRYEISFELLLIRSEILLIDRLLNLLVQGLLLIKTVLILNKSVLIVTITATCGKTRNLVIFNLQLFFSFWFFL